MSTEANKRLLLTSGAMKSTQTRATIQWSYKCTASICDSIKTFVSPLFFEAARRRQLMNIIDSKAAQLRGSWRVKYIGPGQLHQLHCRNALDISHLLHSTVPVFSASGNDASVVTFFQGYHQQFYAMNHHRLLRCRWLIMSTTQVGYGDHSQH